MGSRQPGRAVGVQLSVCTLAAAGFVDGFIDGFVAGLPVTTAIASAADLLPVTGAGFSISLITGVVASRGVSSSLNQLRIPRITASTMMPGISKRLKGSLLRLFVAAAAMAAAAVWFTAWVTGWFGGNFALASCCMWLAVVFSGFCNAASAAFVTAAAGAFSAISVLSVAAVVGLVTIIFSSLSASAAGCFFAKTGSAACVVPVSIVAGSIVALELAFWSDAGGVAVITGAISTVPGAASMAGRPSSFFPAGFVAVCSGFSALSTAAAVAGLVSLFLPEISGSFGGAGVFLDLAGEAGVISALAISACARSV